MRPTAREPREPRTAIRRRACRLPLFTALALVAVLALSAGGAGAQGGPAPPLENLKFERVSETEVSVTFTVPAGYDADAVEIGLNQPTEVTSASVGSRRCQVARASDGRSSVLCPGPFERGTTHVVIIQTAQPYPDSGNAAVGGFTTDGRQIQRAEVAGPGPLRRYDLVVVNAERPVFSEDTGVSGSPVLDKRVSVDPNRPAASTVLAVAVALAQRSDRPSEPTTLTVTSEPALSMTGGTIIGLGTPGSCGPATSGFECGVPALEAPRYLTALGTLGYRSSLDRLGQTFRVRASLACKRPPETECANNTAEGDVTFVGAGDTEIDLVGRRLAQGSASGNEFPAGSPRQAVAAAVAPQDRPRRAEVALLRLDRRQRGFNGDPAGPEEPATGAATCSWLTSRRGRFREGPVGANGTCDRPVWLRARGTRRWSFRLSRPLRPGRYVLYSRAVTRAGATEQSFTTRDRNRRQFRVRR